MMFCFNKITSFRNLLSQVKFARIAIVLLSVCLILIGICTTRSLAADKTDQIEIILSNLPNVNSPDYLALKKIAGDIDGQSLDMTNSQMWSVEKSKIDQLIKAATERNVTVTRLGKDWNHIFKPMKKHINMSDKQKLMMKRAMGSKAAMGMHMMDSPSSAMMEFALTKGATQKMGHPKEYSAEDTEIVIPLSSDKSVRVRRTSVRTTQKGCIWRGQIVGSDQTVTLMWWHGGRLTGTINLGDRIYSIRNLGDNHHAIIEMSPKAMPPEHGSLRSNGTGNDDARDDVLARVGTMDGMRSVEESPSAGQPSQIYLPSPTELAIVPNSTADQNGTHVLASKTSVRRLVVKPQIRDKEPVKITLLVAYTKAASDNYQNIEQDLIALAVEETNQTFLNSNIQNVEVELVHSYMTDYNEGSKQHFEHLWRFADRGDPHMEEVHKIREEMKADVAILIVDDPSGCGLATRVKADAYDAFAVVHHECAALTYSLAHEIGHLIGTRHDRSLDTNTTPFPYGHGHVNGMKWRTMMSYKAACNDCPRLPVWSNPDVIIQGERAGTPMTNNSQVIIEQAARVANFK